MDNYYEILCVKSTASFAEIKIAYRILAKENHPDRNSVYNAHDNIVKINKAYAILKDEKTAKRL